MGTGFDDVIADVNEDDGCDVANVDGAAMFAASDEDDAVMVFVDVDGAAMVAASDEDDDGSTKDAAGVGRDDGTALNDDGGLGKSGTGGGAYAAAFGFGEAARTGDGTVMVLEISRSAIGDGSKRGLHPCRAAETSASVIAWISESGFDEDDFSGAADLVIMRGIGPGVNWPICINSGMGHTATGTIWRYSSRP